MLSPTLGRPCIFKVSHLEICSLQVDRRAHSGHRQVPQQGVGDQEALGILTPPWAVGIPEAPRSPWSPQHPQGRRCGAHIDMRLHQGLPRSPGEPLPGAGFNYHGTSQPTVWHVPKPEVFQHKMGSWEKDPSPGLHATAASRTCVFVFIENSILNCMLGRLTTNSKRDIPEPWLGSLISHESQDLTVGTQS